MSNKWVGLAINFVLALAVAVVFTAMLVNSQDGNLGGLAALGSWSVLAQVLLYAAFRMLADSENRFAAFLRVVLLLAGGALILTAGLIPSAVYTAGADIPTGMSPLGYAFGGCWFLCGVLAFHLYYSACDNRWGGFWFAFMPLLSFAASYILYVIFGYIGEAAGSSFFTGWLGFIVALAGAVFMIVRFIRNGSPFMGSLRASDVPLGAPAQDGEDERESRSSAAPQYEEGQDTRPKGSEWKLRSAIESALHRCQGPKQEGMYGQIWIDYTSAEISGFSNTVRINARMRYVLRRKEAAAEYPSEVKDDAQSLMQSAANKLLRAALEAFEQFRKKYSGYDDEHKFVIGKADAKIE